MIIVILHTEKNKNGDSVVMVSHGIDTYSNEIIALSQEPLSYYQDSCLVEFNTIYNEWVLKE